MSDPERELRATREQLRNLIERNGDAIVVVDDAGLVRFANPAAEALFQRRAADLVGKPLGMPVIVGEVTEVDVLRPAEQTGVAEMRVWETEWGGDHARLAVLRDITDRKRVEQERGRVFQEQVARAQAEQALHERDEFLALASHELKTPAATLSATAQLLKRQLERQGSLERDQLERALDRLEDQSQRLARLVEHLLDVSRINAAQLTIQPQPTDLAALVQSVASSAQLTTQEHTIVVSSPEHLEAEVDPDRIAQVLTNLIDNAIKYSPDGGRIEVELSADDDQACVSVRDFGIGIPVSRRERLFERFYRANTDDTVSGMGLGLFITRHVVVLHGGDIGVEGPPDGGSRFIVRLPRQERAHAMHSLPTS